jgi:hypothetical protein
MGLLYNYLLENLKVAVGGCTTSSTTGMSVTGTSGGITRFTGSGTGTFQIGLLPSIISYNVTSGSVTSSGRKN